MQPADCPEWHYDQHPNRGDVLPLRTIECLVRLRTNRGDCVEVSAETRPVHRKLFKELTPDGYDYFAGNYRGQKHRCLEFCSVGIRGAPEVGMPPGRVVPAMSQLGDHIKGQMAGIDQAHQPKSPKHLYCLVAFACYIFDRFLRIHPYADGNGHVARFLIWAILGRHNYWPAKFPVEPRPEDDRYIQAIKQYRKGDRASLERYVFDCLIGD